MRIGFVTPYSGNIKRLQERVSHSRGNSFQFFARSLRGGSIQKVNPQDLKAFHAFLEKKGIRPVLVHAPYSYNLADIEAREDVLQNILEDLELAEKFRAPYYILHPGYYKKTPPEEATGRVQEVLEKVLSRTRWSGEILIKNMAGAGSELASSLAEWNLLMSFHPRVKGALDLSRAYSAGYAFTTEESAALFYEEVEEVVGWEQIKVLYLNDSLRGCGARKNQYAGIGEGVIGHLGYRDLLSKRTLQEKVWIAEHQKHLAQIDETIEYFVPYFQEKGESP